MVTGERGASAVCAAELPLRLEWSYDAPAYLSPTSVVGEAATGSVPAFRLVPPVSASGRVSANLPALV
jgi:hypothetical protein